MLHGIWMIESFTGLCVYIYREVLDCLVEAVIMDEVEVVCSDHAAVNVSIEWKVKNTKGKERKHVIKK